MSTSLLYHAFGVRGYEYVKTEYPEGTVVLTIAQATENLQCSACGSGTVVRRGAQRRWFRGVPIGSKPVWLQFDVPRVECRKCGRVVRQVRIQIDDPRRSYTKAFVFDHFHIVKRFNEKLTDLRRALYREANDQLQKDVLKGTRWLLVKNPDNLDDTRDESKRLEEALALNQPLATAYYMKEDLRRAWTQRTKGEAKRLLTDWIKRAEVSGIAMLKKFAKTLSAHCNQILNFCDHSLPTGPLEGTYTKIRVLQRKAYGFRDKEFFKLKIHALHESRFDFVG